MLAQGRLDTGGTAGHDLHMSLNPNPSDINGPDRGLVQDMRCLAIGVADVPPLEFLKGAENGAKAFAAWAKNLGIPTQVLN